MKHHILLIEDNDEIRENISEILELANYKVTAAENGKEGVSKAMAERPDLIVCDIMMPILDGYGVLHLLSKNDDLNSVPFIFLTAKSDRADFRRGMEMGADDYVTKPFTDIELLNAIERRLKKVQQFQKQYSADAEGMRQLIRDMQGIPDLSNIAENQPESTYQKKQAIYTKGQHPKKLFFLRSGKVKTYISNEFGKDLTIGLYSAGDFFGYTALLEATHYKETAEAIDEVVVSEIPIESLEKLLFHNKEATRKLIQLLAKNITEKEQQLLDIAYNSLRKRVASALITLLYKYRQPGEKIFTIQISREDLANIAATATESLIRTLSDFKQEKLVDVNGSKITILNEQKLTNMFN